MTTTPTPLSDPLAAAVTRPHHFDPAEDYGLVIARGDNPIGDYDLNDAQQILRYDLAVLGDELLVEGAIIRESGGTIGAPQAGTPIGGDVLGSAGLYLATQSQVYSIRVLTTGPAGTATYTWSSTGADNPPYANAPMPIAAIAPDLATGLADLATYGCPVGIAGVLVVFVNPGNALNAGSSWVIQATYGAQAPVVSGDEITVSDLLVFMQGKVQRVRGQTLLYPAATTGVAVVYGEWTRSLVTDLDDPTLTDPLSDAAQGWRERWTMTLQDRDTSQDALASGVLQRRVVALYQWDRATDVVVPVVPIPFRVPLDKTEGALPAARLVNVDQSVLLQGEFARRIYYLHGHAVAEPHGGAPRAYASTNPATPGKVRITIPPVVAYIQGVEFISTEPQDIEVDQASDVALVVAEPHTFATGTNLYPLNRSLNGYPISAITRLTAFVQVTAEPMTRGATQDDPLPKTPVVTIEAVRMGATTYVPTTDYALVGNAIRWVAGHGPTVGQSYQADYTYDKVMVSGPDYVLTGGAVDFSPPGDFPKNGSVFSVDYTYYQWRTDGIMIRPTGEIVVIRGIPSDQQVLPVLPLFGLPYALVAIAPGGPQLSVTPYNNDALTEQDLCNLRDYVRQLLVNSALTDLVNQARNLTTANPLDVQSDAFATTAIADLAYNAGGVAFDATIDVVAQVLTLPYTQALVMPAAIAGPGTLPPVRTGGAFYSIPFTDELAIDAPKWSADYPVNPYNDFRPEPPVLQVTPDRDFFVDTATLTSTQSRIVQNGRHEDWRIVDVFTTNQTELRNIPFLYMRQLAVQIAAAHLVPGEHVRLQIDGKDVPLTALGGTVQVDPNTVQATPNVGLTRGGAVTASTAIPALVPSGTAPVQLFGDQAVPGAVWPGGYTLRAAAIFTSTGVLRLITTESVVTVVQNDPVAQSVIFPAPRMISKVVVPIAATPAPGTAAPPLLCEVRSTDESGDASAPTPEVLAVVSKPPEVWAGDPTVVFPDPIYCAANLFKSIVLRSASNLYRVYIAQLGGPDRVAGGFVTQQQIDGGIFMDSSNNRDWTLHQDWDLRCQVYVAKMTDVHGYLYYASVPVVGATAIFWTVDQVAPDACGINWSYSIDSGSTWVPFQPFTVTPLAAVASTIQIRAELWTADPYSTPVVHRNNAALLVMSNKAAGTYVSDLRQMNASATKVSGQLDVLLPAGATIGASVAVWLTSNNGATWVSAGTLTARGVTADGYTTYQFAATALPAGAAVRMRVNLTAANPAQPPLVKRLFCYAMP